MKPRTVLLCLFALSFVICGCPISSSYPLVNKSSADKFDSNLLGAWQNKAGEVEVNEIKIEKGRQENTYKITVTDKGDSFMADTELFTGWVATLNNKKFLVLQEEHPTGPKDVFYVYTLVWDDKRMISHNISLKVKGADAITSVRAYQEEVLASMKKEDFLSNRINWLKK